MRCYSCDCELSNQEATRKSKVTGDYFDLCEACFATIADEIIAIEIKLEETILLEEQNETKP